jgi:predicted AlkP superfamily phosphohydrolase/phosphomutase
MIPDGEYTAVVDRFDETLATLELSDGDERYNLVVGEEELPEDARHVDAVCHVKLVDDELESVEYVPEETIERKQEAQDRFDRLSRRPPRDNDQ